MATDATQLKHYVNFPVCGFCINAWDIIYGRQRTIISCEKWLSFCKFGGCDPEVWDYIDERTGWPWGMKINPKNGWPRCFTDHKIAVPIPEYDNRVYHMREDSGPNAPWRRTSDRLRTELTKIKNGRKPIDLNDVEWDEDEPVAPAVDLEDADLWD